MGWKDPLLVLEMEMEGGERLVKGLTTLLNILVVLIVIVLLLFLENVVDVVLEKI
jgi:hypothetical protein